VAFLACRSDYSGQLEFDVGNLSAYDPSPINQEEYAPLHRDAKCHEVATAMTQALVGQLFSLPSEAVQGGRLAQLPQPSTLLPREKPIPKPKPLTKWQKFAQVCRLTELGLYTGAGRLVSDAWGAWSCSRRYDAVSAL
jgi:regulator of ribosome biosynthesis